MNRHVALNVLALLVVHMAVLMDWQWVWGILFTMWTVHALRSGEVQLIGPLRKEAEPVMYWLVLLTWIGLSVFLVVADVIPFIQSLS